MCKVLLKVWREKRGSASASPAGGRREGRCKRDEVLLGGRRHVLLIFKVLEGRRGQLSEHSTACGRQIERKLERLWRLEGDIAGGLAGGVHVAGGGVDVAGGGVDSAGGGGGKEGCARGRLVHPARAGALKLEGGVQNILGLGGRDHGHTNPPPLLLPADVLNVLLADLVLVELDKRT